MTSIQRDAMAAASAVVVASGLYYSAQPSPGIIRAQSGKPLPESQEKIRRRPSWSAKFEGFEVADSMQQKINDGKLSVDLAASARLKRRPSWSAKYRSGDSSLGPAHYSLLFPNDGAHIPATGLKATRFPRV